MIISSLHYLLIVTKKMYNASQIILDLMYLFWYFFYIIDASSQIVSSINRIPILRYYIFQTSYRKPNLVILRYSLSYWENNFSTEKEHQTGYIKYQLRCFTNWHGPSCLKKWTDFLKSINIIWHISTFLSRNRMSCFSMQYFANACIAAILKIRNRDK